MLVFAVALHNLPEGMAVGVVLAAMLSGESVITAAGAFALAIGIAIQNFPEGAIVSMPLVGTGLSKKKAFKYGFLTGVVEPAGALLTLALVSFIEPVLPFILSFAAGAMIYVVVEDLISTGGSSLKAVEALRAHGCEVIGMVASYTYGFPVAEEAFAAAKVELTTLTNYEAVVEVALSTGYIKEEHVPMLAEWRKDPAHWG